MTSLMQAAVSKSPTAAGIPHREDVTHCEGLYVNPAKSNHPTGTPTGGSGGTSQFAIRCFLP